MLGGLSRWANHGDWRVQCGGSREYQVDLLSQMSIQVLETRVACFCLFLVLKGSKRTWLDMNTCPGKRHLRLGSSHSQDAAQ